MPASIRPARRSRRRCAGASSSLEINRRPVRTVADYQRIVSRREPGDVLAIYYYDPTNAQRSRVDRDGGVQEWRRGFC